MLYLPSSAQCHSDFKVEKPEAWFKCVKAQLEDAKVVKSKDKYNKVLGKLAVNIIEEMALVTDNPSLSGRNLPPC
jgi:hypothetical protein